MAHADHARVASKSAQAAQAAQHANFKSEAHRKGFKAAVGALDGNDDILSAASSAHHSHCHRVLTHTMVRPQIMSSQPTRCRLAIEAKTLARVVFFWQNG